MTALSHVSLVIGFGSSCSQPLLAKRPSSTAGSFSKADLESLRALQPQPGCGRRAAACSRHCDRSRRERGVRHDAVMKPAAPRRLELRDRSIRTECPAEAGPLAPVLADDVVRRPLGPVAHRREQLVRRLAAVERSDERLHDRDGPVVPARIAPRLEEVRLGNLPMTERRRLIVVQD